MQWIKDTKVEDFLSAHGVEFEVESGIPIAELVPDWRTRNIGRPDKPILDDVVLIYAEAMEQGNKFPYLVLSKTAEGYQVLDGVQRCCAVETLDQTAVAAYIVKSRSKRILDCLAIGLNFLHGVRPSKEIQIAQAFLLVERHGMTHTEAESEVNLKRGSLELILKCRQVHQVCVDAGIDPNSERFTNGKVEDVSQLLAESDKVIPRVVQLIIDGNVRANEVEQIVKEISSCEQLHDKVGVVERWRKRPEIQQRIKGQSKIDATQQICQMLRAIDTYSKHHIADISFGSAKMANEIESILKRVDGRIKQMITRYRAARTK